MRFYCGCFYGADFDSGRHGSTKRSWKDRPMVRFARLFSLFFSPLLAGLLVTVDPPQASAAVYSPPASIDKSGARDVTADLQKFLNDVPSQSTISFPAGAKYRIEGTLRIANKNDIVVNGNGALFFADTPTNLRDRFQWDFENISNLVVSGLKIRGAHTKCGTENDGYISALEAQHGINITGGERITVANNEISQVFGDFIYVGRSANPVFGVPRDVKIQNNVGRCNGRQGISVTQADGVLLEGNTLENTRRATFDFEPLLDTGYVQNVTVRNNNIGSGRLNFISAGGKGRVDNIKILNNTLTRPMGIAIKAQDPKNRRKNWEIVGNKSTAKAGSEHGVIWAVNIDGLVVKDNVQPVSQRSASQGPMHMVGNQNSCFVSASGNQMGEFGGPQVKILSNDYDCPATRPPVTPISGVQPVSQYIAIDAGGKGSETWGIRRCSAVNACGGMIVGGSVRSLSNATLINRPAKDRYVFGTLLEGNPQFEIPIRSGTYNVTLYFAEPSKGPRERRFHVDLERKRWLSSYDVFYKAKAKNALVSESRTVTVGDGALSLSFLGDGIVNYIEIERD